MDWRFEYQKYRLGNWRAFLDYTQVLLPFLPRSLSDGLGWIASIAEGLLGVMLIFGYRTKEVALASAILTLIFALCMSYVLGFKSAFNYSVFAVSVGSLLLSTLPGYKWSLDWFSSNEKMLR
jgi:uncharacterized membrane protein YphA (DoxX/SURF4 family)